jgi:hypothetical protein
MTTEKYKCIAQPNKLVSFTIGKEYELSESSISAYPYVFIGNDERHYVFRSDELNQYFQKVEPTTTQPMKYKVTITSADHTGHEDTTHLENQTESDVCHLFEEMAGSTFHVEPMPKKQKVKVWFYVIQIGTSIYSCSNTSEDAIMLSYKNEERINGRKVSEIKSMEVEI